MKNQEQIIKIFEFEKKYFVGNDSYKLNQLFEMMNVPYSILGVEDFGQIVGYLIYQDLGQEIDIIKIFIDPKKRKTGLATLLMEHCFKIDKKTCWLEVNEKNDEAIKFYISLGFKEIRKRNNYYLNDSAVVMKKTL